MKSLLGTAIGTCLSKGEGLRVAYLPAGVYEHIAVDIVRTANRIIPSAPAMAVLVTDGDDDESDDRCPRLTASSVIGWRHDDRLVVVDGQPPETASFSGAVDTVLPATFPVEEKPQLTLSELARTALDCILEDCGAQTDIQLDKMHLVSALENSMLLTLAIHREFGQTLKTWNANWFNTVDRSLQTLSAYLTTEVASRSSQNVEEVMEAVIYACFGLPALGGEPRRHYAAKDFHDAWITYWASEEMIDATTEHLSYRHDPSGKTKHRIETASWATFDMRVAILDNHLAALVELCSERRDFLEAVAALAPSDFLDPYSGKNSTARMAICGLDERPLGIEANPDAVCFLQSELKNENGRWFLESEEVKVALPLTAVVDGSITSASKADLKVSGSDVSWVGSMINDGYETAYMVGRFRFQFAKSNPRYNLAIRRVTLHIPPKDPLQVYADPNKSVQVCVLPADLPALIVARKIKSGLRDFTYSGPRDLDISSGSLKADSLYRVDLRDASSMYAVLVVNAGTAALQNGRRMQSIERRAGLYLGSLKPSGTDVYAVDDDEFEISVSEATASFESPLEAAIHCERVSSIYAGPELRGTTLGALESAFTKMFLSGDWEKSLGHFAMPSDRDASMSDLRYNSSFGMYSSQDIDAVLTPKFQLPQALLDSEELVRFIAATTALNIKGKLSPLGQGQEGVWPSKVSWRHLFSHDERAVLDEYLSAYCALVAKARSSRSPYALFWATYPFSVAVWTTRGSFDCTAVLLSPLHPLRLAWLASAEATLWDSKLAPALAGTVEGWNFPVCGPRTSMFGRMVAVPIDAGIGSLFLGWSMLVPASLDTPETLGAPSNIGNMRGPGSAISGLNGTAATAAIRSYMRLNPHVTTLTVDLAASANASRLSEIDSAVVSGAIEWVSKNDASLPGGVRVFDSFHRRGEPSESDILRYQRKANGAPLVWKRYLPDLAAPIQCSVRVLQDSGTTVSFGHGEGPNQGITGHIPLRRFEVQTQLPEGSHSSDSRPALRTNAGWLPFSRALSLVENSQETPEIQSHLSTNLQSSNGSEWTISGEAFLNPSVMAQLVDQATGGTQMLWEWRPPFLDALSQAPSLQRRPFVSITKVPGGFREGVAQLIGKAVGQEPEDSEATKVLSKLGSRGVGLSTLFSMGDNQASGALGFYLAFKLSENLEGMGWNFFVLPMDASDGFLRALAGGNWKANGTQRADLLVIAINDDELVLVPVEVKCYKLLSEQAATGLPKPGGKSLDAPIQQLKSSMELLTAISHKWQSLNKAEEAADISLWLNGLAAVIEAAMRLHPFPVSDDDNLHRRLGKLLDGTLTIRTGKPLLTYFQHDAQTQQGQMFDDFVLKADALGQPEVGVVVANTGYAYTSLDYAGSDIAGTWRRLVSWAVDKPDAPAAPSQEPAPDPKSGDEAEPTQKSVEREMNEVPPPTSADLSQLHKSDEITFQRKLHLAGAAGDVVQHDTGDSASSSDGVKICVGHYRDTLGVVPAIFWPSNTMLNQMNVGVVGDLGTGKTQLLQSLVFQLRRAAAKYQKSPLSFLIIDYKEDFQKEEFLSSVGGRVLKPLKIPLNIFALPGVYSPEAAYKRATEFFDVVSKIYSGVGPIQRYRLVDVIVGLFDKNAGTAPTLSEVLAGYKDLVEKPDSMTAILSDFVYGGVFSENREELKTFEELISDSVLVLALKDLGTNQRTKNALVVLFLNMYFDYMLRSQKPGFLPGVSTKQIRQLNSFLLVDEATNIMAYDFPVLEQILLQGREFGFGTILSSQFLKHFTAAETNYGEPLLTWFIHKVPQVSLKELQVLGLHDLPASTPGRIASQAIHEAFYVSLDVSGRFIRGLPFHELMALENESPTSKSAPEATPSTGDGRVGPQMS